MKILKCNRCKEGKHLYEFSYHRGEYNKICKECVKKVNDIYKKKLKEGIIKAF